MTKEDTKRLSRQALKHPTLKHWQDTHYDEYCDFCDLMHDRNGLGFAEVFKVALEIAPKYEKTLMRYLKDDRSDGIEELEKLLTDAGLAEGLELRFRAQLPDCIVPAMLCWLFFGRSFECMVEYGEEMIQNSKLNFLLRKFAQANIKLIISRSLKIGARKQEDWIRFAEELEDMGVTPTVTNSVISKFKMQKSADVQEKIVVVASKKPLGKEVKRRSLEELIPNGNDNLFDPLDGFVKMRHKGRDIAMLYIALHKGSALVSTTVTEFHAALCQRYEKHKSVKIPLARGIQEQYKHLMSMVEIGGKYKYTFELPHNVEDFNDITERLNLLDYAYDM